MPQPGKLLLFSSLLPDRALLLDQDMQPGHGTSDHAAAVLVTCLQ
jgi:hypothetical protein